MQSATFKPNLVSRPKPNVKATVNTRQTTTQQHSYVKNTSYQQRHKNKQAYLTPKPADNAQHLFNSSPLPHASQNTSATKEHKLIEDFLNGMQTESNKKNQQIIDEAKKAIFEFENAKQPKSQNWVQEDNNQEVGLVTPPSKSKALPDNIRLQQTSMAESHSFSDRSGDNRFVAEHSF